MIDTADLDGKCFVLNGPMKIADPARTAVRGDLAHVALAGRYFVPHYAVPMARVVHSGGAQLLGASRADSPVLAELAGGSAFAVLDIAGGLAWGQCGDAEGTGVSGIGGFVGYVPLDQLEPAA
ncbi:MAG: SH3 domain-containing protein [Novosphingobium sp.]